MRFGGRQKLTLAQQLVNLQANPICAGAGAIVNRRLEWRCDLSPTAFSRIYSVRIEYILGCPPDVFVEFPDLRVLADGRNLPHVYSEAPICLCLYLPGSSEWGPWMLLDRTVVPWTLLWLFYFEEWLRTGEWGGSGRHPDGTVDRFGGDPAVPLTANADNVLSE